MCVCICFFYITESVLLSVLESVLCTSSLDGNPCDVPVLLSWLLNVQSQRCRLLRSAMALSGSAHTLHCGKKVLNLF